MDRVMEALKERYRSAVLRKYMSQIRGDILKEFLLAIHLHNVPGEGEILESDGKVKKLSFPSDEKLLKDVLMSIRDNEHYLFIWNPGSKNTQKSPTRADRARKVEEAREEESIGENLVAGEARVASVLFDARELLKSYVDEFELWGIIITDIKGNPLIWALCKDSFSVCDKNQSMDVDENTALEFVKLFVSSKSEFMNKVKEKIKNFQGLTEEQSRYSIILSLKSHAVRATNLGDEYVVVMIMAKDQLGFSSIVENKVVRELKDMLR